MIPYADFTYFALIICVVIPTTILALFRRAGWRWVFFVSVVLLLIQYYSKIPVRTNFEVRQIWIVVIFGCWQWGLQRFYGATTRREGLVFYGVIAMAILPLFLSKVLPLIDEASEFGFVGISYVTFRALDILFSLRDRVVVAPGPIGFFNYLFFVPTISAGPIDRYRRFLADWKKQRTWAEFLIDLDFAVHRIFRGFLYKFILAALIKHYWLDVAAVTHGLGALASYMYAYSFYLFFDFAGYSSFAIAFSYILGVHTPENFDRPFIARNIRDFWNRWHITLSFWFRDHVYMRFLLAARRGQWIANKHATAIAGYFLSFGLMGLWHGFEPHFIIYGLYHATLLSGYHLLAERRKGKAAKPDGIVRRAFAIFVTFNLVCFGFLIFSGHLGAPVPEYVGEVDRFDCEEISGWAYDKNSPNSIVHIDLYDGHDYVTTITADEFRQRLISICKGDGKHGFRITTPAEITDGRRHSLTLTIGLRKAPLTKAPLDLICR